MNQLRKISLVVCVLIAPFVLNSCGGGGSSSTPAATTATTNTPLLTATVINGITVPVEPDPTANAATLKGVDSNNNGVRDDVERKIAEIYPASSPELLARAKLEQKIIENNGDATAMGDAAKPSICKPQTLSDYEFYELIYNTPERKKAQSKQPPVRLPEVNC
jgi:hypothetical protein